MPALTRAWEEKNVVHKIESLRAAGWTKWEAANLSAWTYLGLDPSRPIEGLDLATDWSVYVLNRLAAQQLIDMGVSRFCLSPEDGFANSRSLWTEFPTQAVLIAHQDTPLFLAESCAYANLIGGCPGKANCSFESMEVMASSHGESVTAMLDYHCRTIVATRAPTACRRAWRSWKRKAASETCGPTSSIERTSRQRWSVAGDCSEPADRCRAGTRPTGIAGCCECGASCPACLGVTLDPRTGCLAIPFSEFRCIFRGMISLPCRR